MLIYEHHLGGNGTSHKFSHQIFLNQRRIDLAVSVYARKYGEKALSHWVACL
jgi:hypothetical protein